MCPTTMSGRAFGAAEPVECFRNAVAVLRILVGDREMAGLRVPAAVRAGRLRCLTIRDAADRRIRCLTDNRDVGAAFGEVRGEMAELPAPRRCAKTMFTVDSLVSDIREVTSPYFIVVMIITSTRRSVRTVVSRSRSS